MNTKFQYQPNPKLQEARAELAELRALSDRRAEVQAQVNVLRSRVALLETKARYEKIDTQELESAKTELTRLQDGPGGKSEKAVYLADLVDRLERQEREENERRLKPLYRAAMVRLDRALEAIVPVAAELESLRQAGGPVAVYYPNDWFLDFEKSERRSSRLQAWRYLMHQAGWLDEGPGWTNEAK